MNPVYCDGDGGDGDAEINEQDPLVLPLNTFDTTIHVLSFDKELLKFNIFFFNNSVLFVSVDKSLLLFIFFQ